MKKVRYTEPWFEGGCGADCPHCGCALEVEDTLHVCNNAQCTYLEAEVPERRGHAWEHIPIDLHYRLQGNEPEEELLRKVKIGEYVFRDSVGDFVARAKGLTKQDPVELQAVWALLDKYTYFPGHWAIPKFKEGVNIPKASKQLAVAHNKLMRLAYRKLKSDNLRGEALYDTEEFLEDVLELGTYA